ncbi:hypothetical protein ACM46_11355 [Chryseobacterium angstadtii]|uniref:Uncharacterized protein n=1 Tax=Chryseobacterium angstadtii TaxID=558151 RepID=A0A0J7IFT5_9FLAO|nr:hypothetical protein [Chryseobacterium angstadtii]KMQ64816.1 hypothetical protein ACM46_11355 [Chryseobacterium angstadtii]
MKDYRFYKETSPNVYQRKSLNNQYIIMALLLFAVGLWFFIKRGPQAEAYIFAGIVLLFGCGFLSRMFSSVVIDMNRQTVVQKAGLLSATQQITFSDIQSFSINNRIYVLILISSAFAVVMDGNKQKSVLLGQSLMNSKNTEVLLLETEKILGIR